ncbi:hypothetical protein Tco_1093482 [Tanacetum coccineum]|uniref:Uncharacterized protein n=1 Tax=Tanacetum coccineum TaxID=301880 RepID=A0ABQ5IE60_9ASTR
MSCVKDLVPNPGGLLVRIILPTVSVICLQSFLHRDTSINDSQKIDSLLDEFAGELTLLHSIPLGIDVVNRNLEGDILFLESLLYDNSFPRPPEDSNSDVSDAITESFSPSPIPVEDSDSLMEEFDLFHTQEDYDDTRHYDR